jgi:hypothetical protein
VVSEPDGNGSSARILTLALASLVGCILWKLVDHLCQISDPVALRAWLGAMPVLIAVLVGLVVAPYGINKGAGVVSDR